MTMADSVAREARMTAHLAQLGSARCAIEGDSFDVNVYDGQPFDDTGLLLSVGLSGYVFPRVPGAEATSFEVGFVISDDLPTEFYADVVFETGEQILEQFFDSGIRPAPGQLLENSALTQRGIVDGHRLTSILLGWSVWLTEGVAWNDDPVLGPLAILDMIALTEEEADSYRRDKMAFEKKTISGEVDLLQFRR
ncbi:MAG: hypothetical protein L0H70_06580 [Xanthomonadales bacterium]|nr:hypothetical protein [Xanthomonadales bacterium]